MAEMLMFVNTGPCNAVIANVVMPNMRSAAYAVTLFAVHVLGDIWSPPLMAWVADTFAEPDAMGSIFGHALAAVGALPTQPTRLLAAELVGRPARGGPGRVALRRSCCSPAPGTCRARWP